MLVESIIQSIERMSVLELVELSDELSDRWGVPVSAYSLGNDSGVIVLHEEPVVGAQTEFQVMLTGYGANKIAVIKAVREMTSLGLKEAKALVESCSDQPAPIGGVVAEDEAQVIAEKLHAAGATCEVR